MTTLVCRLAGGATPTAAMACVDVLSPGYQSSPASLQGSAVAMAGSGGGGSTAGSGGSSVSPALRCVFLLNTMCCTAMLNCITILEIVTLPMHTRVETNNSVC